MSLTLELPPPISDELSRESQREGISETEHAELLICLASAFMRDESVTPFRQAVRAFLSQHALDADRVFSVFEELVQACAAVNNTGKSSAVSQAASPKTRAEAEYEFLKQWRNRVVHQSSVDRSVDVVTDVLFTSTPPVNSQLQVGGRLERDIHSDIEGSDPREHLRTLLAHWRTQDYKPISRPVSIQNGETPTRALFRMWEEEDAALTELEQEQKQKLFEEFQQSVDSERKTSNMRTLF